MFEISFLHGVARGLPKCITRGTCDSLLSYFYRGFESRRVQAIAYRQRFGNCPFKALKNQDGARKRTRTFCKKKKRSRLPQGKFFPKGGGKLALPVGGYRAREKCAKRNFRALSRRSSPRPRLPVWAASAKLLLYGGLHI